MEATAVASENGGAGKRTVVVGLAASFSHDFGLRVGVVDLDLRSTARPGSVWSLPGRHVGMIRGQDDVALRLPLVDRLQVLIGQHGPRRRHRDHAEQERRKAWWSRSGKSASW